MISTRIIFILEQDGFASWQLSELKKLTEYFNSVFVFYNLTQGKQARLSEILCMLSIGNHRYDMCEIAIEGLDAELACMVLTEYLDAHTTLISNSHKKNHHFLHIFRQHPALFLPFEWQWHYQVNKSVSDKKGALHLLAQLAAPKSTSLLMQQLEQREFISSTAITNQIALPHVLTASVNIPTIIVLNLPNPLDWGSIDNKVNFILGLILPCRLEPEWVFAFTRLTRWIISGQGERMLLNSHCEEAILGILLYVMSRGKS
ncbi:MAG: PTS sugar transporter subunit IIA [Plesiomonas sp.]